MELSSPGLDGQDWTHGPSLLDDLLGHRGLELGHRQAHADAFDQRPEISRSKLERFGSKKLNHYERDIFI